MLYVVNCLVEEHNLWASMLALCVCAFGALATMRLIGRAGRASGRARFAWGAAAAGLGGWAIWSTHFIAMLGYRVYPELSFGIELTAVSLLIAVIYMAAGVALAMQPYALAAMAGGAVAAAGIVTMHYVGMSATIVPARMTFDPWIVVSSAVLGALLFGWAFRVNIRNSFRYADFAAPALLVLGVLVIHFGGMVSISAIADPSLPMPEHVLNRDALALVVAFSSIAMIGVALLSLIFDDRLAADRHASEERLRAFADAAVEGLVVCENGRIIDANRSFLSLCGMDLETLVGRPIEKLFRDAGRGLVRYAPIGSQVEVDLDACEGRTVPVELVLREVPFRGALRQVYAFRDLSERRAAEERIRHMAFHDALTGLPNRSRLAEIMAEKKARGEPFAALAIDLDRFKEVNDIFGHKYGDALLCRLAVIMSDLIGADDLLARIGGDEFMIVQSDPHQPAAAEKLAERLVAGLCDDITIRDVTVRSGCSMGIAIFPEDGASVEELNANADAALYRAKESGRGSFRFFEPHMDQRLRERRLIQAEMRAGLINGEFSLHYQPQFETATGALSGFEALLRWQSPQRGWVEPSVFIPLAEETGFIVDLGQFVLSEACAEAAKWSAHLKVGVNLSPVQFQYGDVDLEIARVLKRSGLAAERLEVEITEGVLMRDLPRAQQTLKNIKALGVQIAMDDFGTGYSSLSYLQAFPFDRIKIDKSFIRDIRENRQSEAIVRAIISLGRGLGLPIVAEGVETEEQHEFLNRLECQEVQGYLLGRPQPIGMFAPLLNAAPATAEPQPPTAIGA